MPRLVFNGALEAKLIELWNDHCHHRNELGRSKKRGSAEKEVAHTLAAYAIEAGETEPITWKVVHNKVDNLRAKAKETYRRYRLKHQDGTFVGPRGADSSYDLEGAFDSWQNFKAWHTYFRDVPGYGPLPLPRADSEAGLDITDTPSTDDGTPSHHALAASPALARSASTPHIESSLFSASASDGGSADAAVSQPVSSHLAAVAATPLPPPSSSSSSLSCSPSTQTPVPQQQQPQQQPQQQQQQQQPQQTPQPQQQHHQHSPGVSSEERGTVLERTLYRVAPGSARSYAAVRARKTTSSMAALRDATTTTTTGTGGTGSTGFDTDLQPPAKQRRTLATGSASSSSPGNIGRTARVPTAGGGSSGGGVAVAVAVAAVMQSVVLYRYLCSSLW
ncbi:potassium/sodium hyperpolarization-activated cyclic nucleotide-gated channel 1-like [Sycon ciliatum]|uniref:potassium/sodium hyperpolarization-activated cyclic nucleotide-gated channel 1-like n=1 Tax=Sycon ciliatum TaxID=27933 RepID=UPI0031F68318